MGSELFYLEVRRANKIVREIEATDKARAEAGTKLLTDAVAKMVELACMARKEGILALEDVVYKMDKSNGYDYLEQILLFVIDGTEPEIVEDSGNLIYFADDLSGYEALQYNAFLWGALAIQQGTNPRLIEQQLLSMMTKSVKEAYKEGEAERERARKEAEKAEEETADMTLVEKYSVGESPIKPGNEAYFVTQLLDYLIRSGLDDCAMQRVLMDIYDSDLVCVMKALSGEARRKIFKNLSKRHAALVAERIEYCGLVQLKYVIEAEHKVLTAVMKLYGTAEIRIADGELADSFSKVIGIPYEKREKDVDLQAAERDLTKLVGEYMSRDRKMI